jgi:hypothetical protein
MHSKEEKSQIVSGSARKSSAWFHPFTAPVLSQDVHQRRAAQYMPLPSPKNSESSVTKLRQMGRYAH